jgi:hypothetical protein
MHSLALALDGSERSASRTGRFTPRERAPGTHWIGGSVGPRALSLGVKRSEREADHSPPSSAEVKNASSYTSTPPIRIHGMVLS